MMNNTEFRNARGSALLFILIGVALFAALSYAVTQSLRITTDSKGVAMGTAERNSLVVTDIMQFMSSLKIRVSQMTGIEGVPATKLDFKNDVYKRIDGTDIINNSNSSCTDETCRVFEPYSPTGVRPMIFNNAANSQAQTSILYPQNGHGKVGEIAINDVGSDAPELVFLIYGIQPQICNLYNQKQGIITNYDATTTTTSIGETNLLSTPDNFAGFVTTRTFGYSATAFAGKKSFCAPAVISGLPVRLAVWQVLIVR